MCAVTILHLLNADVMLFYSCCCISQNCKWCKSWGYPCSFCEASGLLDSVFYHRNSLFSSSNWCYWVCNSLHLIICLLVSSYFPSKKFPLSRVSISSKQTDWTNSLTFFCECRSRIRDTAEKQFQRVATGDTKPNSWTLLDFGKSSELVASTSFDVPLYLLQLILSLLSQNIILLQLLP